MSSLRLVVASVDPVLGDLDANASSVGSRVAAAARDGDHLVVLGGGVLTGHPCGDLVRYGSFGADTAAALECVARQATDVAAVVGFADVDPSTGMPGCPVAICAQGRVVDVVRDTGVVTCTVGVADLGVPETLRLGVVADVFAPVEFGPGDVDVVVVCDTEAFDGTGTERREELIAGWASATSTPVVYVNLLGGQDEFVFDGARLVLDATGTVVAYGDQFDTSDLRVDLAVGAPSQRPAPRAVFDRVGRTYDALVLATHDYVTKNGFSDVVIGLSGGLDSSLVAAVAVDALGAAHVHGVSMPSRHSSAGSLTDAEMLARNLGIDCARIPIEPAHAVLADMVGSDDAPVVGLADENLQPRIRGVLLMALSNMHGWLVLTTGNKSEAAVGYSTLYGDTAGAFGVIKDVYKTFAYELCRHRNSRGPGTVIPEDVLTKAPSAELRPDQRDADSLPPYEVLDAILEAHLEGCAGVDELIAAGFDAETVRRVTSLVASAEYKRRQSPFGPRVTTCSLGVDHRLPSTNRYRHTGADR